MKYKRTGSITIFMSLMLMVVASLLFTLLEGSRFLMLGMTAVISSQSVTESMFAEYNVPAYQNYHLFMMDSSYGTGQLMLSKVNQKMQELGQENLNPSVKGFGTYSNFLQMNVTDSSVVRYELATDQNAQPLLKQISQLMKKEFAADLAEGIYHKITDVQESGKQGEKADQYLNGALDTIEQAKEEAKEAKEAKEGKEGIENNRTKAKLYTTRSMQAMTMDTGKNTDSEISQEVSNPMEDIKNAKSSPLLAQILSSGDGISAKQISSEDSVERRTLNIGNYESTGSSGLADKMLIIQYLKKYTSNFLNKVSVPHALAYEQEYILFGKSSDEDNLKKMASKLLTVREGINFAYLLTDKAKCEEALAVAVSIVAVAQIPAAVKAIQMGILASWAYAESIAELRTLFAGGKIAAVKSAESWTVSLAEAASVPFRSSVRSKEVSSGLDYEDYIYTFLSIESLKKIGNRFANMLEKNLRLYAGYEQVKLDCMITAMEADHHYHAKQAFLTFVTIGRLSKKGYHYEEMYRFSYIEEKNREEKDHS